VHAKKNFCRIFYLFFDHKFGALSKESIPINKRSKQTDTVSDCKTIRIFKKNRLFAQFRARVVKRLAEEDDATTANGRHDFVSSPWQWQRMHLKKKNSEIISVLMGLRRAMSNNYENGVGERRQ